MRPRLLCSLLLLLAVSFSVGCAGCPGCPKTATEAGLPARVDLNETSPSR